MTLTLVLLILATTRITRAVTTEDVGAPIRRTIVRIFVWFGYKVADHRYPNVANEQHTEPEGRRHYDIVKHWLDHGQTLATCPWCLGFWISLVAVITYAVLPSDAVAWLSAPWALSYTVGILDGLADRA